MLTTIALSIYLALHAATTPTPPSTKTSAGSRILSLISEHRLAANAELDPLYADLDPILCPEVFGIYTGGFFCGKVDCNVAPMSRIMGGDWAGKHIVNETWVNPFLTWPLNGTHDYIQTRTDSIAQIHNIQEFGKTQATLTSAAGPFTGYDYLRIVANDTENGLILIGKTYIASVQMPYLWLKKDPSMMSKLKVV